MKKFLLSLGLIATMIGAFTLTSCKDDDEPTQEKVAVVTPTTAVNALAAQLKADGNAQVTTNGEKVTVVKTDASGQTTTTTYAYTYTVNEKTYPTTADFQAALRSLPAGSYTVTVQLTRTVGTTTTVIASQDNTITVSDNSTTKGNLVAPTTTTATTVIPYVIGPAANHSGGQAN